MAETTTGKTIRKEVEQQQHSDGASDVEESALQLMNKEEPPSEESRAEAEKDAIKQDQSLADDLSGLSLRSSNRNVLICDAGYGFPSEARPRREKILAVAKQLCNFLQWQATHQEKDFADIRIVVSSKKDQAVLQSRLEDLWGNEKELPDHVEFCNDVPLEKGGVYLSPDSPNILEPTERPPPVVIVGMLIDRRIQPNRSLNRSGKLGTTSARWPLEACGNSIHPHEPLNVDVVLEGMQQWWWNVNYQESATDSDSPFVQAATQALRRHYERHPNRPLHKPALDGSSNSSLK